MLEGGVRVYGLGLRGLNSCYQLVRPFGVRNGPHLMLTIHAMIGPMSASLAPAFAFHLVL